MQTVGVWFFVVVALLSLQWLAQAGASATCDAAFSHASDSAFAF